MTDGEARELARDLVRGSIIEDAAAQFIAQILKHAHDERIKPLRDRAEQLEALLREARSDLEVYITNEYPKDKHPYYEGKWNRDMELCRRIDAALKGADHDR